MTTKIVKSTTVVRVFGSRNTGQWLARVRLMDGQELFAGDGAGYTMAQAQVLIENNEMRAGHEFINPPMRHPITRETLDPIFTAFPDGVAIKVA